MNAARNLLHNMKIKIAKLFLFRLHTSRIFWSSDLHMAWQAALPHVQLAAWLTLAPQPSLLSRGWLSGHSVHKHFIWHGRAWHRRAILLPLFPWDSQTQASPANAILSVLEGKSHEPTWEKDLMMFSGTTAKLGFGY